ncbi:RidA family protein [Bradyrhizobium sp.]|uniref:RidA family protein n=1 Tax=Bradyrhizobium sp. TaxID=376 RepID=UPI002BCBAC2F|nr:Rid family hydrolase [Bradyrhizobium sp.]HWX64034.1 Rid family hydrolase [Bradyrhizobium sp.]
MRFAIPFIVVDLHHLLLAGLPAHLCENAKAINRDRASSSLKAVFGAHIASAFNFKIELENIILVALRTFAFSHSPGHFQTWLRVGIGGCHDMRQTMTSRVQTFTPPNTPKPIGPYSHIAKVGEHIWIGGTAGFDPATGTLTGADVGAQTRRIFESFKVMLEAVSSDLNHVTHINVFLLHMSDFEAMNAAYVAMMGDHRPARTVVSVRELPKPGVLLTMNLTAVTRKR